MKPTRDRILTAAERIQQTHGIDAITVRAVARDVGVTPMAIYRHFPGKDGLLEALVLRGFEKLEVRFREAANTKSPMKAIERALLAYGDFAVEERSSFELMFLTRRPQIPSAPESVRRSPSAAFETLIGAVREAVAAGDIAPGSPEEIILFCWAEVHGLVALHFTGRFGDDARFKAIYRRTVDRLLELLRTRE